LLKHTNTKEELQIVLEENKKATTCPGRHLHQIILQLLPNTSRISLT
jgi:hypothetical protein